MTVIYTVICTIITIITGITQSDVLVINKIDLAEAVGASLGDPPSHV